ncbi:hypothetical protein PHYPO_G00189520 [Pangasianodon hypophthalmus]|uniref:THAP-type domain-containing protein n=1 Tax=Pangasianodon hypophthalmus TaxID=310915 RepID=A0A5N5PHI8_PANHP|nr:hypothetical protein PHYPO_G00189520 [Pangasianodon hypophthalmus]
MSLQDQDCHLEVGPRPSLPVQSEVVSFPQPNHKLAFTNLHDSTSSCTFVNPRMNRKGRSQKMSFGEENTPTPLSACSEVEEKSWREAVKSLQTYQETSIFKSSEVLVNTQCLLELFQFCWLCQKECCITIEGNEKLFSVTQDCQSCGYHRDWRSHPPSAEPAHTFHKEEEHILEDEDGEEVVVHIVSSDNECSEQVFIEKDGSYLSSDDEEASLQEEEVKKKRKRTSKRKHSSDEWEPCLDEEATDSDVSMDEDLFTALKEDGQGKLVVWCTQCGTEASLSCSVHRHKKAFCCAQCSAGDDIKTHTFETLRIRFDDVGSFQKHAEQEHGVKPFYRLCQDCGKFVIADPESRGLKEHKCEHKSKFIICPECGKRFLTKVGLKSHYTQLHSDYDHPCKYCLKVFKTSCTNKMTKRSGLSFHRLPFHTPEMLHLWLLALRMDVNTPVPKLRAADLRVCGAHFSDEDFFTETARKTTRKLRCLKRSAVPHSELGHHWGIPDPQDCNLKDEPRPVIIGQYEIVTVPQPDHKAVKSLQPSYQGTSIFKSSEVLVNTHCLLELFQFCWLCHKECCITIEGNEKLFSVTQDCQNCGHHRDWRNHPPSAEPAETYHNEPKDHVETFDEKREDNDDTTSYIEVEHTLEPGDEDSEEVVVQIGSSDHEGSEQSYEQMFIETDGSYFSSTEEETSLQEEMMMKKKKKKKKNLKEKTVRMSGSQIWVKRPQTLMFPWMKTCSQL